MKAGRHRRRRGGRARGGVGATRARRRASRDRAPGPEPHFWYRPLSVAEPFQLGQATRYDLGALAVAAGATFTLGMLQGIDVAGHVAKTSVGEVSYDVLLVAVGALPTVAVEGALTFRGPADSDKIRGLLDDISAGTVRRLAFVVPSGSVWSLPIYELALMTASNSNSGRSKASSSCSSRPRTSRCSSLAAMAAWPCVICWPSAESRSTVGRMRRVRRW